MIEPTFICEACDKTFNKKRSDEAADDEAYQLFGPIIERVEMAVICHDCFRKLCPTN